MAKPTKKYKAGGIQVSRFDNEVKKDGKTFVFKTLAIQRSYKDKEGKWVNETINLNSRDCPKLLFTVEQAYKDIVMDSKEVEEE
jgi:hypothetical protein